MAKMIPGDVTQLPENSTSGEKNLYRLIKKHTPEDWVCYANSRISSDINPDFLIIGPNLGILILEEKSLPIDHVKKFTTDTWTVIYDGHPEEKTHPLKQARNYIIKTLPLMKKIKKLLNNRGELKFPYGHGVILSNIIKEDMIQGDLRFNAPPMSTFEPNRVICKDDLPKKRDKISDFSEKLLLMNKKFKFEPLSEKDIEAIRFAIFPTIRARVLADEISERNEKLEALSIEQEQFARGLGKNDTVPHRQLNGVAGSGKTIILKTRVTDLINNNPDWKILVTFFNRSLKRFMEIGLPNNIDVLTIGQSIYAQCLANGLQFEATDEWSDEFFKKNIEIMKEEHLSENIYDAILLDESQDLKPMHADYLRHILSDSVNCAFFCGDLAQKIYRENPIRWVDHGFHFVGRTSSIELSKNYRNTKQIFEFAWNFIKNDLKKYSSDKQYNRVMTIYENIEFKNLTGAVPKFRSFPNEHSEKDWICGEIIRMVQQERTALGRIAIIYPNATNKKKNKIDPYISQLQNNGITTYWISEGPREKSNYDPRSNQIAITTPDSAKGLEWEIVFMPSIETYYPKERANHLRFVAATRALHFLYPSACGIIEGCPHLEYEF